MAGGVPEAPSLPSLPTCLLLWLVAGVVLLQGHRILQVGYQAHVFLLVKLDKLVQLGEEPHGDAFGCLRTNPKQKHIEQVGTSPNHKGHLQQRPVRPRVTTVHQKPWAPTQGLPATPTPSQPLRATLQKAQIGQF